MPVVSYLFNKAQLLFIFLSPFELFLLLLSIASYISISPEKISS